MAFLTDDSLIERRRRAGLRTQLSAALLYSAVAGCESSDEMMMSGVVVPDGGRPSTDSGFLPPPPSGADAGFAADASTPPDVDASRPDAGGSQAGTDASAFANDGALDPNTRHDSGADASSGSVDSGSQPVVTCPPAGMLRPGDTNRTVQVGGVSRRFILHVPTGYTGDAPVPLVIDWHPIFGTGSGERASSGYARLSDREGFVVAFPDGIDGAWNVGPCCTSSRTVDDVGFARAIVKDIQGQACIDPKRIYTTGFSMGGGMSHYLACNAADLFAASVPASFDLLAEAEQPCKPARPIGIMSFRSMSDFVVPYEGGASNPPNGLSVTIHFRGAVATFDHWKTLNGCTGTPTTSGNCQTYTTCQGGVETSLCTISGGHTYGDANLGWAMMKRHTLP